MLIQALLQATRGVLVALWVPPVVAAVFAIGAILLRVLTPDTPANAGGIASVIAFPLAIAGIAMAVAFLLSVFIGIPILFVLRLCRLSHPVLVGIVFAGVALWYAGLSAFQQDPLIAWFSLIAGGAMGFVAALQARSNSSVNADAPRAARRLP